MVEPIVVLYVENGTNKFDTFTSKVNALLFVEQLVNADRDTQNNIRYLTGVVFGEYHHGTLDYKEKDILKRLKGRA